LWKHSASKGKGSKPDGLPAFSSPLVEAGLVYYGTDNHSIYALDVSTGAKAWELKTRGKIHDNSPALKDATLYFGSQDGCMYALAAASGKLLWRVSSPPDQTLNTTPMAWGDKVYYGSGDKSFLNLSQASAGFLNAVRAGNGAMVWQFRTGVGVMSSPAVDPEGRLVFGSGDKKIYCLNAETGAKIWSFDTGKQVVASPLITGGIVYVGSLDGHFNALSLGTGGLLWSFPMEGGVFTSAAALGNRVVVADLDGNMYCFLGKTTE
jgi:outer membrane protein assembly factor BamB